MKIKNKEYQTIRLEKMYDDSGILITQGIESVIYLDKPNIRGFIKKITKILNKLELK